MNNAYKYLLTKFLPIKTNFKSLKLEKSDNNNKNAE